MEGLLEMSASKAAQAPTALQIYQQLSFLVKVAPLKASEQSMGEVCSHGDWNPPTSSKNITSEAGSWFIWKGGNMTLLPANHVQNRAINQYCVSSVFSQGPAAPHLLAASCNADQKNAGDHGRWNRLKFNHKRVGNSNIYYSEIDLGAAKNQIAAPAGSAPWRDQLLPSVYDATPNSDSQGTHAAPTRVQGGLIGKLSLLIALAAFSAPANKVGEVFRNHVKPHRWHRGGFNYPCGRNVSYRGMVVTVCFDPINPSWSTKTLLDGLQEGRFGPFYGGTNPT